jgi:anti-sigma regulatory factor (Ser/Thr protein kinase)
MVARVPQQKRQNVKDVIRALLAAQGTVTNREIVSALGGAMTRQAVAYHLRELTRAGEVEQEGAGRGARYRYPDQALFSRTYALRGLAEDEVWQELRSAVSAVQDARSHAEALLAYAFTEMLNNAIDHSGAHEATVRVWAAGPRLAFSVIDHGVGAFPHVQRRLGLPDLWAALAEISKGKATTAPAEHSGEGIFFTSKAVDLFMLESAGLRWTVDNVRRDQAVGESVVTSGTVVRWQVDPATDRRLEDVFAAYTAGEDLAFDTSRVVVRLFEHGSRFVSRSEARRLAHRLEEFEQVIIDFAGVTEVGQGFVDQLFRVWAGRHPGTVLRPVNMAPAVEFMVQRGLP